MTAIRFRSRTTVSQFIDTRGAARFPLHGIVTLNSNQGAAMRSRAPRWLEDFLSGKRWAASKRIA
jgi:hypothetical protein